MTAAFLPRSPHHGTARKAAVLPVLVRLTRSTLGCRKFDPNRYFFAKPRRPSCPSVLLRTCLFLLHFPVSRVEVLMRRFFHFACLLGLILPLFPAALAQQKHPFTFDDMMKLKRVAEPVPSPDGKWVVFSVVDVDLAANTKTPHIWIVPASGGQEREIIAGQDADRPRWAPDGKHFAFISNKVG